MLKWFGQSVLRIDHAHVPAGRDLARTLGYVALKLPKYIFEGKDIPDSKRKAYGHYRERSKEN